MTGREIIAEASPSTAAIAGHPIHPMLIPYPYAFLTTALVTDVLHARSGDPFWARTSKWLLQAGVVAGAAAAVAGIVDYMTIERARRTPAGKLHAIGNSVALALALVNAMRRGDPEDGVPSGGLALSATTTAILGVTGWAGGELSYRHGIGVAGDGLDAELEAQIADDTLDDPALEDITLDDLEREDAAPAGAI